MTNASPAALNVMIVDDDASVADVAAAVLSKAGCKCTIADQSEDLLEQIKTARPDIVIVDIMMPQVDGLELCRQIKTEEDLVSAQMDDVYFPIMLRDMGASIKFKTLGEQSMDAGAGSTVDTMLLSHPGNCLGYRVTFDGRSVCYITDNELYLTDSPFFNAEYEDKLAEFVSGCDILITDTTYFDEDYPAKVHWGHSSVSRVLDLASKGEVKSLHLFHHDPDQVDDDIDRKLSVATEKMKALAPNVEIAAPAEGQSYSI